MKRFLMGVLATLVVGVAIGAAVVYSGTFDVSADTPHSPLVHRLIETTRERAIERRAREVAAPANLADAERVRRGAGNYAAMCMECHLAPGQANSEIRMGLYPAPPDLARPASTPENIAARQFWIIKHGIKATGMPAWSKGGIEDEAIWDMVAFLQQMPALTPGQYLALVESSDGHSHGGITDMKDMHGESGGTPTAPPKARGHDNSDGHAH
ncbi:MAG: cytochrome C [Hydrogenophilales bacterium 17-61-9]|nr:MAG: cytochrome C [Hydrogenophilales bacterium 17-61-9]